jgi:hypothetical protein
VTYNIAAGATDKKYIYWDPNYTTIFRDTNDLNDVFNSNGWVMCINDEGSSHPVYGLPVIHARLIQAATITADLYAQLRQTYVYTYNEPGLDSSHPAEFPFKIVSEMTSIISVLLSFRIMPYRAYSTAAASGGGSTPTTDTSYAVTQSATVTINSGGTSNTNTGSGSGTGSSTPSISIQSTYISSVPGSHGHGTTGGSHTHTESSHSHGINSHTHTANGHTHVMNGHYHNVTIAPHSHGITYGLHEESNSPTVNFNINNGSGFGGASGNYTTDQLDIDITSDITGTGWKAIRFNTDLRCRIAAIIECKLDVTA